MVTSAVRSDTSFEWFCLALAVFATAVLWLASRFRPPTHLAFPAEGAGYRDPGIHWTIKRLPQAGAIADLDDRLRGSTLRFARVGPALSLDSEEPFGIRLPSGSVYEATTADVPPGTSIVDGPHRYVLVSSRCARAIEAGSFEPVFPTERDLEAARIEGDARRMRRASSVRRTATYLLLAVGAVSSLGLVVAFGLAAAVPVASQRGPFVAIALTTVLLCGVALRVSGLPQRLRAAWR